MDLAVWSDFLDAVMSGGYTVLQPALMLVYPLAAGIAAADDGTPKGASSSADTTCDTDLARHHGVNAVHAGVVLAIVCLPGRLAAPHICTVAEHLLCDLSERITCVMHDASSVCLVDMGALMTPR